jgi:hypothetical protein
LLFLFGNDAKKGKSQKNIKAKTPVVFFVIFRISRKGGSLKKDSSSSLKSSTRSRCEIPLFCSEFQLQNHYYFFSVQRILWEVQFFLWHSLEELIAERKKQSESWKLPSETTK